MPDIIRQLSSDLTDVARSDLEGLSTKILRSRLGDTTEFGRAVHAEMAAITTAARLGIPVGGTTLVTDTFPCHNCARHIVATGIRRVVYVAPYAKSKAHELHDDSVAVAPAADSERTGKVIFEPFIGISPRRADQWFANIKRKDDDGTMLRFDPKAATPRIGTGSTSTSKGDANDLRSALLEVVATIARENLALNILRRRLPMLTPTLLEPSHEPV